MDDFQLLIPHFLMNLTGCAVKLPIIVVNTILTNNKIIPLILLWMLRNDILILNFGKFE